MLICSTNADLAEKRSLLKELYDEYGRMVLGICYDILRSRYDSELAAQETFSFIYRTADTVCGIDSEGILRSYIAVCAKHCAMNLAGKYDDGADSVANAGRKAAAKSLGVLSASELDFDGFSVEEVASAVPKLEESQREILFLKYCCELPMADIATLLGMPQPDVSTEIRYALAALRYAINNYGGSDT